MNGSAVTGPTFEPLQTASDSCVGGGRLCVAKFERPSWGNHCNQHALSVFNFRNSLQGGNRNCAGVSDSHESPLW